MAKKSRGFVTIAVGEKKYYEMALNLLRSYRYFTSDAMPFAIIADCKNEITDQFDDVTVIEKPQKSYMDKIDLTIYAPYDETIFVDADCLAYRDLNILWQLFDGADDFSSIGEVYPLEEKNGGWFKVEDIGAYGEKVHFITHLHGGIYFIRRGEKCHQLHDLCLDIIRDYDSLTFSMFNDKPADEPVFALGMALMNLRPREYPPAYMCFYPSTTFFQSDIAKGMASFEVPWQKNRIEHTVCVHWGSIYTNKPIYRIEVFKLHRMILHKTNGFLLIKWMNGVYECEYFLERCICKICRLWKKMV